MTTAKVFVVTQYYKGHMADGSEDLTSIVGVVFATREEDVLPAISPTRILIYDEGVSRWGAPELNEVGEIAVEAELPVFMEW